MGRQLSFLILGLTIACSLYAEDPTLTPADVVGPDGLIYFCTSNRDGRGALREGDDKIYRLVPVYE